MKFTFTKKSAPLFKKHKSEYHINPARDWQIILGVFALLMLVIIGASVYMFLKINSGDIFQTNQTSTAQANALDISRLETIKNYYAGRAAALKNLQAEPPQVADPSLN